MIYLKGIESCEMQSILEFIYLGHTTVYQSRMTEFMSVAKTLEIKDISKDIEDEKIEQSNNLMDNQKVDDMNTPELDRIVNMDQIPNYLVFENLTNTKYRIIWFLKMNKYQISNSTNWSQLFESLIEMIF